MAEGGGAANRAFLDYKVVAKTAESAVITSLVLAPVSGRPPVYRPGQHLVFRINIGGAPILRHYSISGDTSRTGLLRISVKREEAPARCGDVPAGLGSGYMHDCVQIGDTLTAAGPVGEFILDESSDRPVLLFSGGVGLTPMICMLHRLAQASDRRVYFVHACENGDVHAFADEVTGLARRRPGISVHFAYRAPTVRDRGAPVFHSTGLVSRETLQELLPLDDYDVYLCGPTAFMQANWRLLRGLGIAAGRIHYEFFGPATVLQADERAPAVAVLAEPALVPSSSAAAISADPGKDVQVSFGSTGVSVPWDSSCPSLLDLAERAGLSPDFNCRAGLCNTCMSTLVSGEVEYFEPPLDPPPAGKVLLCCSRPAGPVVIELAVPA